MYRNMANVLKVINLIAEQKGAVPKYMLKSLFELYKQGCHLFRFLRKISAFSPFFRCSAFSFFMLFCINNFILLLKIQHRRKPDIIQ